MKLSKRMTPSKKTLSFPFYLYLSLILMGGLVGCSSPAETGDEEVVVFDFGFGQQDTGQSDLGGADADVFVCDDTDGDGVCDEEDICEGGDDSVDTDGDGTPDDCDCGGDGISCDENASCVESDEGEVTCECDEGFEGDGFDCADIDECLDEVACGEGAVCTNEPGSYDCVCESGFVSDDPFTAPCLNVDECLDEAVCGDDAECTDLEGSYECACPFGYISDDPYTEPCVNANECAGGESCAFGAICSDTEGGYSCECESGYESDDPYTIPCADIDECLTLTTPCGAGATCTNEEGAYDCACDPGYGSLDAFTESCADIDECAEGTDGCDLLTDCVNSPGTYSCTDCPSGYAGTGETGCLDQDECALGLDDCDPLSDCVNTEGSYTCGECPSGYAGTGDTGCYLCDSGYEGLGALGCLDLDECALGTDSCDPLSDCVNTDGSYTCGECPSGYAGTGATGCYLCEAGYEAVGAVCVDINECDIGSCDSLTACTNTDGSFYCSACPSGYSGTGLTGCDDIDECETGTDLCSDDAACSNSAGSYDCTCNEGFSGDGFTCSSGFCDSMPSILLYENVGGSPGYGTAALDRLGCDYTPSSVENFSDLLHSGDYGMVVFASNSVTPSGWDSDLAAFVRGGGGALISMWTGGSAELQDAMGFSWEESIISPIEVTPVFSYPWFSHPFDLSSANITPNLDTGGVNGAVLGSNWDFSDRGGWPIGFASFAGYDGAGGESSIMLFNWGRTLMNGFLWSDYTQDTDGDDIPDIEEFIANQVVSISLALNEHFVYLPWDFWEWEESQAAMLVHSLRRGHLTDPTVLAITECVDQTGSTSSASPGGDFSSGEYGAVRAALDNQGFEGEILVADNIDEVFAYFDDESNPLPFDVILFMEQESCSITVDDYGIVFLYAAIFGKRVVATGLGSNGVGQLMSGDTYFGVGAYQSHSASCDDFDRLDPEDEFWSGAPESNTCANATHGIILEEGGGAIPMSVSPTNPNLTDIYVVSNFNIPGSCADDSAEQVFLAGVVGCAGSVTYANRDSLCGTNYSPCTAQDWLEVRGDQVPTHNYWVEEELGYDGAGSDNCFVSYVGEPGYISCGSATPMRVCAANPDPEGNGCNWLNCGWEIATPNEYFGGCAGNTTAGTLCCN